MSTTGPWTLSGIRITIKTDNAAFHAGPEATGLLHDRLATGAEVARILRVMADEFETDATSYPPRDINGNVVGTVEIT